MPLSALLRVAVEIRHGSLAVAELLAPSRCLSCRARAPLPWCARCEQEVRPARSGCRRCATPRGQAHGCWPPDAPIEATVAAFDYRGVVAASIVTAKLGGARSGWPVLAGRLGASVAAESLDLDAVTWITTGRARIRERGVDHARVLADGVAEATGLPALRLLAARPGGDGSDRYRALAELPGSRILLVDDVVTTGATAWRAASALRRGGAGSVVLAVLARAGTHPLGAVTRGA